MSLDDPASDRSAPASLDELRRWVQERLEAPEAQKAQLTMALDRLFDRQRELWQTSKVEAVQALSAGFADELGRLQHELEDKEKAVQNVARYFEGIVAGLTDRTHRDPKTRLLNFDWFMHRLEAFLAIEQRVRWCAAGVVDIARFKWFNDRFGHAAGDRIIQRVARLLAEQTRSRDLLAQDASPSDLHARFGGDEFTFLLPDLPGPEKGFAVANRFKQHVERFPWQLEDVRLGDHPVRVDVGIVCLQLGPLDERRGVARPLAEALISRADQLMYAAKSLGADRVHGTAVSIRDGRLVETDPERAGDDRPRPAAADARGEPGSGDDP
jgi:diguanylate cyclase (GGDEF)-like protein